MRTHLRNEAQHCPAVAVQLWTEAATLLRVDATLLRSSATLLRIGATPAAFRRNTVARRRNTCCVPAQHCCASAQHCCVPAQHRCASANTCFVPAQHCYASAQHVRRSCATLLRIGATTASFRRNTVAFLRSTATRAKRWVSHCTTRRSRCCNTVGTQLRHGGGRAVHAERARESTSRQIVPQSRLTAPMLPVQGCAPCARVHQRAALRHGVVSHGARVGHAHRDQRNLRPNQEICQNDSDEECRRRGSRVPRATQPLSPSPLPES